MTTKDDRPWKIPAPKGLGEYIRKHCAQRFYLMFSYKHGLACCTRCDAEFSTYDFPVLWHSDGRTTMYCPNCGAELVPKDLRYGRKKLKDVGRITWTRGIGSVTFIETDDFIIDYTMPHPEILYRPVQQIRMTRKSQERYDLWDGPWRTRAWEEVKTIRLKVVPNTYGWSRFHSHLFNKRGNVNVGTDLRYANPDVERFDDRFFDEWAMIDRLIRYMSDFLKYPATEILEKSGFDTLVINRASGIRTRYVNMRAKDLRKILKVNGADVRKLREEDPTIGFMENLHRIRKLAPWAEVEDIEELNSILGRYVLREKMDLIEAHTDMSKLLKRLLEEKRETGDNITLSDYGDYLEAVNRLGLRLDKRTLYPKNFMEAHDQAINEAEEKKPTIDSANFARFQKEITGMTDPFVLGGLLIRPAKTPQELRKESQILNHCVRTYVDKVARGTTSILFIRKTKEPNRPYFTLELSPKGQVVQCRGDHNRSYPEEVRVFIDSWMKWRSGEIKRGAIE